MQKLQGNWVDKKKKLRNMQINAKSGTTRRLG